MNKRYAYFIALATLLSTGWAEVVFGQFTCQITGLITDSLATVIPGAHITVVNEDTGFKWEAVSNEVGRYVLPLLLRGRYRITVQKESFRPISRTGITLDVSQVARLDFVLEVGSVTEVITVQASVPLLKSETSAVGEVIRQETIANMPLINRRAAQLTRLNGFFVGGWPNFSLAGGRGDNSMWTMDGGIVQNVTLGVPGLMYDPPIEALEEFNVSVSNYKAELGRSGGGVVQMTTKSGTNHFHGSAYEYVRNDAFDARNFFSWSKPPLRRNQFGGAVGGPIKKDQTHFFCNYEGIITRSFATRIVSVPGPGEAAGDFSQTGRTIRDPLSGAPFPNNIIPQVRMEPVGRNLAALYPAGNVPNAAPRRDNYQKNRGVKEGQNYSVARVDHILGNNDWIFGRFLVARPDQFSYVTAQLFPEPGVDPDTYTRDGRYYDWSATWFHNFSPTTINEARFSWGHRQFINRHGSAGLGLPAKLGLKGVGEEFFPRVSVTGLIDLGANEKERKQAPIRTNMLVHSITHIGGNHTIKTGWEYRSGRNDDVWRNTGVFDFNATATGDALASLLLGWVNSGSRSETLPLRSRADAYGAYIQDDWKVTPNFTLNLGLRWDMDQPRWEQFANRQNSFNRNAINPVCNCPGVVTFSGRGGRSKYAHNFDKNNLGPRVGFAWRKGDWVIRGGGAIVYAGQYDQATPFSASLGFSLQGAWASPDGGRTPAFLLGGGLPAITLPSEADLTPGFGAVRIGASPNTAVEFFEPTGRRTPYLETFNFNIQRQLGQTMMFELGYLATLGHKLAIPAARTINQVPQKLMGPGNQQVNRPFPQFTNVTVLAPAIGNSNYHGLNFKIEKRYSHGLHFSANYTWSKLIDDGQSRSEIGGNMGDNAFADLYNRGADRALSGNHIAHRFIWGSVYELPVGRGKAVNVDHSVWNQMVGGWAAGLIFEARSGSPFGVIESNASRVNAFAATLRSDVVGPYSRNGGWRDDVLGQTFFATSSFAQPAAFTFGNAGRTLATGPGAVFADLSILKNFRIAEGHRLEFRVEMTNFINRANFGLPEQRRDLANFGLIGGLTSAARIIQFGLRYQF